MYSVSSTSALVLLWTDQSNYKSPLSQKFWKSLNLEAGRPVDEKLKASLPNFSDLAMSQMNNRKYGIRKFSSQFLSTNPNSQVIFLGAGLDPKSLDTAETYPQSTVFDVDIENMELKEKMTADLAPNLTNIKFCTANVGDIDNLLSALKAKGWKAEKTTLVVAEGITYYVSKKQFRDALRALKTSGGAAIVEYAVPNEDVVEDQRKLVTDFFNQLQQILNWPTALERYSLKDIDTLAKEVEAGRVETLESLELEKGRTGEKGAPIGPLCVSYLPYW